jgi:methenyltetrahydrofolate cyclohydrolase
MNGTATTADHRIGDWLGALASDAATPGGGAVAGLSGAIGAALLAMTGRLTIGRPDFADLEVRMQDLIARADAARTRFLELADEDAHAFDGVMQAFKMPKGTDDERSVRSAAIQRGYVDAARVPLEVARAAVELMSLAEDATALGNPQASSDGYSGAIALYAAARCAIANVLINASSLKDVSQRDELIATAESLRAQADELLTESETAFKLRTLP